MTKIGQSTTKIDHPTAIAHCERERERERDMKIEKDQESYCKRKNGKSCYLLIIAHSTHTSFNSNIMLNFLWSQNFKL